MRPTNCHQTQVTTMSDVTDAVVDEQSEIKTPKSKKAKTEKSKDPTLTKATKTTKTKPTQPRIKRGPARPHRRLAVDVIDSRITKLQKRLDRARSQIDDAGRHVEGYLRERDFRAKEAE